MKSATGRPQPACRHKAIVGMKRMGALDCLHDVTKYVLCFCFVHVQHSVCHEPFSVLINIYIYVCMYVCIYVCMYVCMYVYTHIIFVIYISYILYIANVIHKVQLTLLTYSNLLNSPYLINNYISLPFPYCIPLPFSKLCFPQPPKKKGY